MSYFLILAMLLWGGGWTALKILTLDLPMDVIIFWRFFIMSVSFIPILYFFKTPIKITPTSLQYVLASALLNISFMVCSFIAVKYGLAGSGSVIITTFSPILTFVFILILFRKKIILQQYIGLFLGLWGASYS